MTDVIDAEPAPNAGEGGAATGAVDSSRVDPKAARNLRRTAARGTLINSGFQIGLGGLGAFQRLVVSAFLTRVEFGLWGVIASLLVNLSWLKNIGVADKYIQQSEPDQEAAFQKAFTLELFTSIGFFGLVAAVVPIFALGYGHGEMILPGLITALAVPISAFESPAWIPYRRLQYARQRLLTSIDPLVAFALTVGLAVAGAGYWCFVAGILGGSIAGAIVCTITCPYRLRIRFSRQTLREYMSFSWPLVGAGLSRLLLVQGSLLFANHVVGLAGIGAIGLATTIIVFADQADNIISQTIYPAVCAVAHRADLMAETFVKSNRLALMWGFPFGVALALFADDLVHFLLGEKWQPAIGLLAVAGLAAGFGQVAFNWALYFRAMNRTRPIFYMSVINVVTFLAVSIPTMLAFGLAGYAAGFAATTAVQLVMRGYYTRQLFSGFRVMRQLTRALLPTVPAVVLVLAVRVVTSGPRPFAQAAAEVALYAVTTIGFTYLLERRLLREVFGYVVGRTSRPPIPTGATADSGSATPA